MARNRRIWREENWEVRKLAQRRRGAEKKGEMVGRFVVAQNSASPRLCARKILAVKLFLQFQPPKYGVIARLIGLNLRSAVTLTGDGKIASSQASPGGG